MGRAAGILGAAIYLFFLASMVALVVEPFDTRIMVSAPTQTQEFKLSVEGEGSTTYVLFQDSQGVRHRFASGSVLWFYDRKDEVEVEEAEIHIAPNGQERSLWLHLWTSKDPKKSR